MMSWYACKVSSDGELRNSDGITIKLSDYTVAFVKCTNIDIKLRLLTIQTLTQ